GRAPTCDPGVAKVGDAGDALDLVRAHPDRRPWPLNRFRADRDAVELVEAAFVGRGIVGPERPDRCDRLDQPCAPFGPWDSEALELGQAVALSDTEQELSAANHVERRGRLGHADWLRQRENEAGGAEV